MKARESGMPDEALWRTFFSPARVLARLGLSATARCVVDLGCGYGTFTVPAARRVAGIVHAFDIDPAMIETTGRKAGRAKLRNLRLHLRDFLAKGTGLPGAVADYVMLFNLLHAERPMRLLRESWRILKPGGRLGILHWNPDPGTPRGPSISIRPRPEDCRRWAAAAGFAIQAGPVDLPPFHYGILARKPDTLDLQKHFRYSATPRRCCRSAIPR